MIEPSERSVDVPRMRERGGHAKAGSVRERGSNSDSRGTVLLLVEEDREVAGARVVGGGGVGGAVAVLATRGVRVVATADVDEEADRRRLRPIERSLPLAVEEARVEDRRPRHEVLRRERVRVVAPAVEQDPDAAVDR